MADVNGAASAQRLNATTHHHDPDAEAAVLSALMLSPSLFDELRDVLEPIDFFLDPHRALYQALLDLDDGGTRIDIVTVKARLEANGAFRRIGGAAFLGSILDATPSVANVGEHARLIRQLGVLRRMGSTLRELASVAQRPESRADVDGFLQRCEAEVFTANVATTERETASSLRDVMTIAAEHLDPSRPREARGIGTGLRDLDELTLGMSPGELWYVAARPGMGKTALALGIASSVAETGRHAAFFSMEMTRSELGDRLISSFSGVPHKLLLKRQLSHEQWANVTSAVDRLSRLPIMLDDSNTLTPARLRSRVRRLAGAMRAKHPQGQLALVVVDYVQLMAWDKPSGNRNDELERISRALKILAREFGVTVLALAQLNRAQKDRADKRPSLTDLRGSGALEQDADKVLFVHRDESEGEERGEAELILGKGRNAGTGRCEVGWEPWCVRFMERQGGFAWQRGGD